MPPLFRLVVDALRDARQVDVMVALGTHLPLNDDSLNALVGITPGERATTFSHIRLLNHAGTTRTRCYHWDDHTGSRQGAGGRVWHPSLGGDVPVRITAPRSRPTAY